MSVHEIQPDLVVPDADFASRLRSVGLSLVSCDETGQMADPAVRSECWLGDMLGGSGLFRSALRRAADQWSRQHEPAITEVMPGLWLLPIPVMNRRRRIGYQVAVIATDALPDSEQFSALCQPTGADVTLSRQKLADLPPVAAADVPRIATLVRQMHDDQQRLKSGGQAVESVGKQLAESYEEMNLLYTIIQSMTVQERPERFVAVTCQELLKTLPYTWIGTQFVDDRKRLKSLAGRLIVAGDTGRHATTLRNVVRTLLSKAQPDTPIIIDPALNPEHAPLAILGKTALVHPVSSGGEVLGLLIAGEKYGADTTASNVDIKLLGATATHMAIFLENAALYDDLNAMFLGTLEALTASIDAKDRYTCGHSRRVALLTQQLALAIGLDEHTCQRMHIAGLVHDVGKIGVPESVLLKPGKLTQDEYAWIRRHPEMGYRILKDIPQLHDILPGVLHHHERWDGRGYPQGLSGEAIPLVARLIGLADSFDAMSSTRTYRSAMTRRQVMDEILQCTAAQFDPSLARVFVQLDFAEFDQLVREHQARELDALRRREEAA